MSPTQTCYPLHHESPMVDPRNRRLVRRLSGSALFLSTLRQNCGVMDPRCHNYLAVHPKLSVGKHKESSLAEPK